MSASAPLPAAARGPDPGWREKIVFDRAFARIDPVAMGFAVGVVAGALLWLATAVLLLRGGEQVGFHLQRLAYYLPGFSVTWAGALVGLVEGAAVGAALGAVVALLWNAYHRMFLGLLIGRETRRALQDL